MNISSIGSISAAARISSNYDSQIKGLVKQKERLQEQIKRINESDTDEQTKKEYIKVLKKQIAMVEAQIQQKNAEKMQQVTKQKTEGQKAEGSAKDAGSDINAAGKAGNAGTVGTNPSPADQADFIKADFSLDRVGIINAAKKALDGRGQVLSQEITLDLGRGDSVAVKEEALQKIEVSKMKLDGDLGENLAEANMDKDSQVENQDKEEDHVPVNGSGNADNSGQIENENTAVEQRKTAADEPAEKKKKLDLLV